MTFYEDYTPKTYTEVIDGKEVLYEEYDRLERIILRRTLDTKMGWYRTSHISWKEDGIPTLDSEVFGQRDIMMATLSAKHKD